MRSTPLRIRCKTTTLVLAACLIGAHGCSGDAGTDADGPVDSVDTIGQRLVGKQTIRISLPAQVTPQSVAAGSKEGFTFNVGTRVTQAVASALPSMIANIGTSSTQV